MTSPYIEREMDRLYPKPQPFDRKHYEYSRTITDGIKIEKSDPPIESWFSGIVACACMVFLVIAAWVVAANIAQELVK